MIPAVSTFTSGIITIIRMRCLPLPIFTGLIPPNCAGSLTVPLPISKKLRLRRLSMKRKYCPMTALYTAAMTIPLRQSLPFRYKCMTKVKRLISRRVSTLLPIRTPQITMFDVKMGCFSVGTAIYIAMILLPRSQRNWHPRFMSCCTSHKTCLTLYFPS